MTSIVSVPRALPERMYARPDLTAEFASLVTTSGRYDRVPLDRLHANAESSSGYRALPKKQYVAIDDFGPTNDASIAAAIKVVLQPGRDS